MKGYFLQSKFTAGEWSKRLEGQVDLQKYGNACYRLENFYIDPHGPVSFRPGWRYIAETKDSTAHSYLVPFEFSANTAYILEFGHEYIRFYKNRAQLTSGGNPYELASPYDIDDLADVMIKWCQSADVMYLFHPDYATRKLSRTGDTSWVLSTVNWKPAALKEQGIKPAATLTLAAVTGDSVTFTAGSAVFQTGDVGRTITSGVGKASITAFNATNQVTCDIIDDFASVGPIASQSWTLGGTPVGTIKPSVEKPVGAICTLTGSNKDTQTKTSLLDHADPPNDNWLASGSGTNEYYLVNTAAFYSNVEPGFVYINGGISEWTGGIWGEYVTGVANQKGTLGSLGVAQWGWGDNDTLGYDTIYVRLSDGADPDSKSTVASPDDDYIQRSAVSAAPNLFRSSDVGKYIRINSGLIKLTGYTSALVVKGEIIKELTSKDESAAWTLESEVWDAANGYPSCGTFYEDRLCVSGCAVYPETVWGSVVGDYENFTPGVDDADAVEFTVAGREVSSIKWVEPDEYLMVGSSSKISRVGPDTSGDVLTPTNVVTKKQSSDGAANIMPVPVRDAVLYVMRTGLDDSKGLKIGEIAWSWEKEKYVTPDMTIMADHVSGDGFLGICYQKEPYSILWAYDEDGNVAAMTYLRDEDVVGWHRHPTDGVVESMATIPGDGYHEVWAIIKRTINGSDVRYVEVMSAFFNDDADTYTDNKGLNAFFVDCGITYNGAAATTITGLDHLEGETVVALADGAYAGSHTVASGQITLTKAATVVHVGLPYEGILQTMRLDVALRDGTTQGRVKSIDELTIRVFQSGPFKEGRDEDNLDSCYDKDRVLTMGAPYPLFTGDIPMGFDDRYNRDGRIMVVQDKPMPLTVVALITQGNM